MLCGKPKLWLALKNLIAITVIYFVRHDLRFHRGQVLTCVGGGVFSNPLSEVAEAISQVADLSDTSYTFHLCNIQAHIKIGAQSPHLLKVLISIQIMH